VLGGTGNDFVFGDKGSDSAVMGEEGRDLIDGWSGSDRMVGGAGGDFLTDGLIGEASKNDILSGGGGGDIIVADNVPAVKDIVSCGTGLDRAMVDRKDLVAPDCERVRVVHGSRREVLRQEEAFFESIPPAVINIFIDFFEEQLAPFPAG
jgi:hemolysin type calcium-binding protein